jgi:hypothetical protein
MTIKLTQIHTQLGETVLRFEYSDGAVTKTVDINEADLRERLKTVKNIIGRSLTLQDVKETVLQIFAEIRAGKKPLRELFDYTQFIDVDLET